MNRAQNRRGPRTERQRELDADLSSINQLYRLSSHLLKPTDLHGAFEQILDATIEILRAPMGNVQLYFPARGTLEIVTQRGFAREFLEFFKVVPAAENSACARAIAARERTIIEDIECDPESAPYRAVAASAGYRAVQSTPLLSRAGEFLGMVSTHFPKPHRPSERELRMLDLYLVHATDTLERLHAEENQRRSAALYHAIGDSIPYGVWICDADGRNTYASPSFLQMAGLTQAEYSQFGWSRVLHPDDASATMAAWRECSGAGAPWEREHRIKGIDGQWHPVLTRGVPIKDQAGTPIGWVGINLDIGNRVRIRELARRQTYALEQTHDAIFQWTFDGGIIHWNRGAERLYGYTPEEALGRLPPLLLETECDGGIEAVKAVLQRDGVWNGELRHHTKGGREIIVESRMLLWREPDIAPLIIEANHDITERKRVEVALRESEQKLREQAAELERQLIASGRLVSLGQVTASMAHEFNNPLGIIIGFAEDILAHSKPTDAEYHALEIIHDEARRCKQIVEDLMVYARPRDAEMSMIHIQGVIDTTLQLVETHLYKRKIEVIKKIAYQLPRIHGDSQQLAQVLVNLFLNAIDALPEGGTLSVGARLDDAASAVVVSVADNGIGIHASEIGKVFEPFYTANKRRGLGLGLSICQRIVKNHGGEIKVTSQVGQGTTFELVFPIAPRSADEQPGSDNRIG